MPAVYSIKCTQNNKAYIGVALRPKDRKQQHFNELLKNKHHNKPMQMAYNKYGKDAFEFDLLYETENYHHAREFERQMLYSFFDDGLFNTTNRSSGFMPNNKVCVGRELTLKTRKSLKQIHLYN